MHIVFTGTSMFAFLTYFVDTLFPPGDDALRVRAYTLSDVNQLYTPGEIEHISYIGTMSTPVLRASIHEAKFHRNRKAIYILGSLLALWFEKNSAHQAIVIPIPLSKRRERERGYNQVVEITKVALKDNHRLRMDTTVLARTKNTTPQTELARENRLTNLKGAFSLSSQSKQGTYPDTHLILLDDVTTTGATLKEAEKVLRTLNPKSITLLALLH